MKRFLIYIPYILVILTNITWKNPAILTTGIKRNFVIYMLCRIMDIKFEMIILNGSHSTNWTDWCEWVVSEHHKFSLIHNIEPHFSKAWDLLSKFSYTYKHDQTSMKEDEIKIEWEKKEMLMIQATLFWTSSDGEGIETENCPALS